MFEYLAMILLGLLLVGLGICNLRGNLATIHWYHRRNVSEEERGAYGRWMGASTVIIGVSLGLTGCLQMISEREVWFYLLLLGIIVGLGGILYAQVRYNKGIF